MRHSDTQHVYETERKWKNKTQSDQVCFSSQPACRRLRVPLILICTVPRNQYKLSRGLSCSDKQTNSGDQRKLIRRQDKEMNQNAGDRSKLHLHLIRPKQTFPQAPRRTPDGLHSSVEERVNKTGDRFWQKGVCSVRPILGNRTTGTLSNLSFLTAPIPLKERGWRRNDGWRWCSASAVVGVVAKYVTQQHTDSTGDRNVVWQLKLKMEKTIQVLI